MKLHSCQAWCISLVVLWTGPLLAQEAVLCPTLPVKAVGQGTTFFQHFKFCEETASFPGITSGELVAGAGLNVQLVTRRIPVQIQRTVYEYVVVFENGRPRILRIPRTVEETTYEEVQEERHILLPQAIGRWTAIDLRLFSSWTIYHLGPDGFIFGAGATLGEELYGSALYLGVGDLRSGWYQLSTGEPPAGGGEGGGESPPP